MPEMVLSPSKSQLCRTRMTFPFNPLQLLVFDRSCESINGLARELGMILSLVTSLEPSEHRLLFRGKERDDEENLHMVGVRDKDKVLLL
ncbi:hypothetical protein K1719_010874 [Acacia pycnantha]|nr:hypothetical protein K1719_010874 [Acacia pycnantha]